MFRLRLRLGVDLKVYLHREPIDFRAGINLRENFTCSWMTHDTISEPE